MEQTSSTEIQRSENSQSTEDQSVKSKKELSREEQLAQFEEALKEEDWGHQPC